MKRRLLVALSVALLGACASRPDESSDYPASLPRASRSDSECPRISAPYRVAGERVNLDGSRSPANLLVDVLQVEHGLSAAEREVRLSFSTQPYGPLGGLLGQVTAARLKIEAASGAAWEDPDWDHALCDKGYLHFLTGRRHSGAGGAPGLVISHGEAAVLFAAEDGSLVAVHRVTDAGVAIVVPWYRRRSSYFLFSRVAAGPTP